MHAPRLSAVLLSALASCSGAVVAPGCTNERVVYATEIGRDANVQVSYSRCDGDAFVSAPAVETDAVDTLAKRQGSNNVCGAACNTFCFPPAGNGPNAGDCTIIADALLYESQNVGVLFNVSATGTPANKITMQYMSCLTYFLNQDFSTLVYCRTEWVRAAFLSFFATAVLLLMMGRQSKLVDWLSSDCDAAHNAQGGLCVATDQRWYVQVQHA